MRILLTGAIYSEHKGSAAILMSTIGCLNEVFPNATFLFCSYKPRLDQKNLKKKNIYVIPYSFKIRSFEFLMGAIYLTLSRNHPPSNIPIIKCISDSDVIIDLSGDTFSSEYGTKSILSIGARIISAKFLRKPNVLYCQSIGPFKGIVDRNLAKLFLTLSDLTIVREYITANNLRTFGISAPVCADPAFTLEPNLGSIKLQLPPKKPIIGINLSQYIDALYGGEQPSNKYRLIMSQFIDLLIEQYNAHILIIPEVVKQKQNSYDDYTVSKKIVSTLKHPQDVTVVEGDRSPSELKAIAGKCEILISPRFHMVIFALAQYVPSIAIAYIPKSYGIMEMIGQTEYVIDYRDITIDLLMKKVNRLWINKANIREDLKIKMNDIQARARYAVELVKLELERGT